MYVALPAHCTATEFYNSYVVFCALYRAVGTVSVSRGTVPPPTIFPGINVHQKNLVLECITQGNGQKRSKTGLKQGFLSKPC